MGAPPGRKLGEVADLHDDDHVQPGQRRGADVEEARGEQAAGLGAQELPPGRPRGGAASGRGIEAGAARDAADGRSTDAVPWASQSAVDAGVPQTGFSWARCRMRAVSSREVARRPVRADFCIHFQWSSRRCQDSRMPGGDQAVSAQSARKERHAV
jgi:hypothetical protein